MDYGAVAVDMAKKSDILIVKDRDVALVTFTTATVSNAERIAKATREMHSYVEEYHPQRVVFDFGKVKFFSSLVLGLLLSVRAKLEPDSGEVVISAINPQLYRVFKITNLDKIFRFFPDTDSAVRAVHAD